MAAAMGNEFEEGNPKEFPAAYAGPLAVGAIDETDRRASFSCTGAHIGLVAPGVNILSTVPHIKASFADNTDYNSWPGTSMATPHVAGCAVLVYGNTPKSKAAADAVIKRLTSTARKLPAMNKKMFTREYGAGLLDLAAALGNKKASGKSKKGKAKRKPGRRRRRSSRRRLDKLFGTDHIPWMSVQFKFSEKISDDRRLEIIEALRRAGFAAHSLFPGQKRPKLASIFTVTDAGAKNVKTLETTLARFGADIEYVEAAPARSPKS